MMQRFWLASLALLLAACGDTGVRRISLPLEATGTSETDSSVKGWRISLTRADLAFGPLYLCAGERAGELCDVAQAEWLESAVIDTLDHKAQSLGTLAALSGEVRSYMYDFGLHSVLSQPEPLELPAAQALDGNSAIVSGSAEQGTARYNFTLVVRLAQTATTERGVPVVRKSVTESFFHALAADERLRLVFSSESWLGDVDFDGAATAAGCASQCREHVDLDPEGQAGRALRDALLTGARPRFDWR